MSVSGGVETERTHWVGSLPTGGTTDDINRFQATEDRRIIAIAGGKIDADDGMVQVSFSSSNEASNGDIDDTKSSVLFNGTGRTKVVENLNVEWASGEELHIHARNNSGASIAAEVTVYYEEL